MKGEWGAEIVDALQPHEGDAVLGGKRGLDSFATTNALLDSAAVGAH